MNNKNLKSKNNSIAVNFSLICVGIFILFASWITPKEFNIHGQSINASTFFIFPVLVITALLSKYKSYFVATKGVILGLMFSVLSFTYGQLTLYFPAPDYAIKTNELYNIFTTTIANHFLHFVVATILANSVILAFLKTLSVHYKAIPFPFQTILSTFISLICYIVIFRALGGNVL